MKLYEISFWVKGENPETDVLSSLKDELFKLGGELVKEPRPTKRRAAYPLKRETEALYGSIFARLGTDKLETLKEKLKHEARILRLMITEARPEKPFEARRIARKPKKAPTPEEGKPVVLEELDKKLEEILRA